MPAILGAGLVALDHIFVTNKAVARVGSTEYLGSAGGGSVGNTLCMLSLFGHSTAVTGVVGEDPAGKRLKSDFAQFGVDNTGLIVRGGARETRRSRQFSHIIYPDGHHSFRDQCLRCGTPFAREIAVLPSDLNDRLTTLVSAANVLHIDRANDFTVRLAEATLSQSGLVSFDYGFSSYGRGERKAERLLSLANQVKVNVDLYAKVTGSRTRDGLRVWRERFPNTSHLFITSGANGIFGYSSIGTEKRPFDLPAIPCREMRDGGGAGDVLAAVLVDQFLLSAPSQSIEEVYQRVNRAQALASLSCTLYGARSLARILKDDENKSGSILELADLIVAKGSATSLWSSRMGIPRNSVLKFSFAPDNVCMVCGLANPRRKRVRSPKGRLNYSVGLGNALGVMVEAYDIGKSLREGFSEDRASPAILVGSGGSLSAAAFGERLIWHHSGKPASAMPPYEFVRLPSIDQEVAVWFLSYGGKNSDILAAAEHARRLRLSRCVVLTGTKKSPLALMAKEWGWKCVVLPGQERSFVATSGMLAMVSAMAGLLGNDGELTTLDELFDYPSLLDNFLRIDESSRQKASPILDVLDSIHLIGLSSGWGWPALVDLESKIVEGGLCTIEISEMKNFTHGRYIGALERRKKNKLILLRTPENSELADFIQRKLWRHLTTITLTTERAGVSGSIEMVLNELFFAAHLARKAGKDISNPRYPPEARGLYDWRPSTPKNNQPAVSRRTIERTDSAPAHEKHYFELD